MTTNRVRMDRLANGASSRLAERLSRLLVDPAGLAGERLLSRKAEQRVRDVLRDIDEIVLPRALHLHRDGKEVARLLVAHRHLIAIDLVAGPEEAGGATVAPDGFVECLVNVLRPEAEYLVARHRSEAVAGQGGGSISAAVLARQIAASQAQNPLDALSKALEPLCLARLDWDDRANSARHGGDGLRAAILAELSDKFRTVGRAVSNARIVRSGLEGLILPLSAEEIVVLASLTERGFAAILPRAAGLATIEAWQGGPGKKPSPGA